ncbi:MAG TPA: hypothetical protein VMP01_00290 [Pirellulaceae bacterium]|nr:hypothetical protein [Pirellulaceae bacterium]
MDGPNAYGTPAFLAPEVATETQTASGPAIDVFGLGSVLLWLLTGRTVHEEARSDLLLTALAQSTWNARVESRMPALTPVGLVELCRRCLNWTPDDRPSLEELIKQCRRFASAPDTGGA